VNRWDLLTDIFAGALELAPDDRAAYLEQRCRHDAALRAEIERLLHEHHRLGNFIENSVFSHLEEQATSLAGFNAGDVLADRFRVIRSIGYGGMGEVYEVEDLTLGVRVAAKALRPDLILSDSLVAQFKREVHLARKVTHPNICRVFDVATHESKAPDGTTSTTIFFTMELLGGETLESRLEREGKLPESISAVIVDQLIAGLAAAHTAGILHGDLKPGNIVLVEGQGTLRAVITDFGLAQNLVQPTASEGVLNGLGTPGYMAPEQFATGELTIATDVYALGLVTLEILVGRQRSKGGTDFSVSTATGGKSRPAPDLDQLGLDSVWKRVLKRCLDPDPSKRFAKVNDIAAELDILRRHPPSRTRRAATMAAIGVLSGGPIVFFLRTVFRNWGATYDRPPSVAVLLFRNHSLEDDTNWLSVALPEALTSAISSSKVLRAISRNEVTYWRSNSARCRRVAAVVARSPISRKMSIATWFFRNASTNSP
jgi:eukaryotic-like serine/threonine-protein kinase